MTWIKNHSEEIEKHTKKLAELESNLATEEKELDAIRDSLKCMFVDQSGIDSSKNAGIH